MAKISARREYTEQNLLRSRLENVFEKRVASILRQYVNLCASEFVKNENLERAEAILEPNLRKVFYAQYQSVIRTFAKRTMRKYQQQKNDEDPYETMINLYIANYGANKVVKVTDTVKELIREIVSEELANDGTVESVAKRIRELNKRPEEDPGRIDPLPRDYAGKNKTPMELRSRRISRTETHSAASYGNQEAARKMNEQVKMVKTWVSSWGDRTRPSHAAAGAANGQIGIDEPFIVGGHALMFPGDPKGPAKEIINCRCVVTYTPIKTSIV